MESRREENQEAKMPTQVDEITVPGRLSEEEGAGETKEKREATFFDKKKEETEEIAQDDEGDGASEPTVEEGSPSVNSRLGGGSPLPPPPSSLGSAAPLMPPRSMPVGGPAAHGDGDSDIDDATSVFLKAAEDDAPGPGGLTPYSTLDGGKAPAGGFENLFRSKTWRKTDHSVSTPRAPSQPLSAHSAKKPDQSAAAPAATRTVKPQAPEDAGAFVAPSLNARTRPTPVRAITTPTANAAASSKAAPARTPAAQPPAGGGPSSSSSSRAAHRDSGAPRGGQAEEESTAQDFDQELLLRELKATADTLDRESTSHEVTAGASKILSIARKAEQRLQKARDLRCQSKKHWNMCTLASLKASVPARRYCQEANVEEERAIELLIGGADLCQKFMGLLRKEQAEHSRAQQLAVSKCKALMPPEARQPPAVRTPTGFDAVLGELKATLARREEAKAKEAAAAARGASSSSSS